MSPILILLLALLIYAGFSVLRARGRDGMRAREVETEARLAAEAERISREGERQEVRDAEAGFRFTQTERHRPTPPPDRPIE